MAKMSINEQVIITAMGFRKNLSAYPKRMEFRGTVYDFVDPGLRMEVRRGGILTEFLTLSDGISSYYLKTSDRGGKWTLVNIW